MGHNTLLNNIAKGVFLPLLVAAILMSSTGIYQTSKTKGKSVSASSTNEEKSKKKEEKITVAPEIVAVVVSILSLGFVKDFLLLAFDFSWTSHTPFFFSDKRIVIAEKYFDTLFTHIISRNAP
ncbi:MAG TPA: hypothetical protein VK766_08875 [Cytophagaceae bacterium]|jgi:hypothetical protein|nr:hypothetical protein [Cytophagaceae bacterium]